MRCAERSRSICFQYERNSLSRINGKDSGLYRQRLIAMNKKLSILIVDDHDTIVSGLKYELQEKYKTVELSVADNILDGLKLCEIKIFDIAIIDVSFKNDINSDGIDLVRMMKQKYPQIRLISYTSYAGKIHYINQLKKLKVDAIASKTDGNFAVKSAIDELLLNNTPFYSPEVINAINIAKRETDIHISKRERDVIVLLKQHLSFKEIADKLCISKNTVDFHAKNLYSKFGVHKASELLAKVGEYL